MRDTFIAWIIVTTTGCVPFPHRVNATPWITGTLDSAGSPVANQRVRAVVTDTDTAGDPCEGASIQARTNQFGKFVLRPKRRMGWTVVIAGPAHQLFPWKLCTEVGDRWVVIKRKSHYTTGSGPRGLVHLRCSLSPDDQTLAVHCEDTHTWDHSRSEIERWLRRP